MSRYTKIIRKLDKPLLIPQPFGFHVGVLDRYKDEVHEVITRDHKTTVYRKVPLSKFKRNKTVQTVHTLSPQSPDSDVKKRLEVAASWGWWRWNGWIWLNKKPYDAAGVDGMNCEHFAELILTGISRSRQGNILAFVLKIGILEKSDKGYRLSSHSRQVT